MKRGAKIFATCMTLLLIVLLIGMIFSKANAQNMGSANGKVILKLDKDKINWDIKIPVNSESVNTDIPPKIYIGGDPVLHNGYFFNSSDGSLFIELDQDEDFNLVEGREYFFVGLYFDNESHKRETPQMTLWAPKLYVELIYKQIDNRLKIYASVKGAEDFYINIDKTYFSLVDKNSMSISHDTGEKLESIYSTASLFSSEREIKKEEKGKEKILDLIAEYTNKFGQSKLLCFRNVVLKLEEEISLNYIILGDGGIKVFRDNNLPVDAHVVDASGKVLQSFKLGGYEDYFWLPPEIAKNFFILKVDGYKAVKFLKL